MFIHDREHINILERLCAVQTVCNVRSPDIGLVELGSTATRAVMSIAVHVVASLYVCRSVLPAFAARRAVVAMPCLTLGSVPGQVALLMAALQPQPRRPEAVPGR